MYAVGKAHCLLAPWRRFRGKGNMKWVHFVEQPARKVELTRVLDVEDMYASRHDPGVLDMQPGEDVMVDCTNCSRATAGTLSDMPRGRRWRARQAVARSATGVRSMMRAALLALLLTACGGEPDTLHRTAAPDAGTPCDACSYDPEHDGTYRCAWGDWPQFYECKEATDDEA